MAAGKVVDLENCPGLAVFSQRKLSALTSVAKGRPLAEILSAHNIDCDFSLEDQGEIKNFEEEIDKLIKDLQHFA